MADDQTKKKNQIITNQGLVLLGESQLEGADQSYWLGYFGFAYVPDEAKQTTDPLSADMSTLTTTGDMIYNIWQGSMTPNGYQTDIGQSNAYDLYTQCQYTNNITANFRYSVVNGKNTLTLYRRDSDGKLKQWGDTFNGVSIDANNVQSNSNLPIPAPLFYMGKENYSDAKVSGDPRHYAAKDGLWDASDDGWNPVPTAICDEDGSDDHDKTSISNFNRYHAPANSDGYMVGREPSCRNMATVTKYFPVDHYTVESTEGSKVAALKLKLVVDLNNIASKVADRTNYGDLKNLDDTDQALNPIGFKFNRIGIYAVPMAVHQYSYNETNNQCITTKKIQYQVVGDEDPVLFAVIDLDQVVTVEEGSSIGKWSQEVVINFGMASDESAIDRNPVVYYNLYEDDSIVWYKNQLIANASTAEAVTNLGIEMNYLKTKVDNLKLGSSCGLSSLGDQYALVGHTHPYFKNLSDVGNASIVNTAAVGRWNYGDPQLTIHSDFLAFVGPKSTRYSAPNWYGFGENLEEIGSVLNAEDSSIPVDAAVQSERSPMILSGGLALGGYGESTSNFMLLRIGSQVASDQTSWPELTYDSLGVLQNPCMWIPSKDNVTTDSSDTTKFLVKYQEDGDGVKHLTTKSPYAGHVLMVMDDQEIDGTLHVGLGKVGGGYNTTKIRHVSITASYVSPSMCFAVEYNTSEGRTLEYLNMTCPFYHHEDNYNEGDMAYADVQTTDGMIKIHSRFTYHVNTNDEFNQIDVSIDPGDEPLYVFTKAVDSWTGATDTHTSSTFNVRGMNQDRGQMMSLNISNSWFYQEDAQHNQSFDLICPGMESREFYNLGDLTYSISVVGTVKRLPRQNYSLTMVPYTMPGYYHNKGVFTNSLRVDSTNSSTNPWYDGNLPYMITDTTLSHGQGGSF